MKKALYVFYPEDFGGTSIVDVEYRDANEYVREMLSSEVFGEIDGLCVPSDLHPEIDITVKRLLYLLEEKNIDVVVLNIESRKQNSPILLKLLIDAGVAIQDILWTQEQQINFEM